MAFASSQDVEFLYLQQGEQKDEVLPAILEARERGGVTPEEQGELPYKTGIFRITADGKKEQVIVKNKDLLDLLKVLLQVALGIELTTIPPYLTGFYSIKPNIDQHNDKARENILNVVTEEMLHAGLAANILTAIGGHPLAYSNNITTKQAYCNYPVQDFFGLKDDVEKRSLSLLPAEAEALDAFVAIETEQIAVSLSFGGDKKVFYDSISEFYTDVENIMKQCEMLANDKVPSESIFLANNAKDQTGKQLKTYYFEYPNLCIVKNLDDALEALNTITWQGEGHGEPPPHERDPTHAQWFIETRDAFNVKPFDTYTDEHKTTSWRFVQGLDSNGDDFGEYPGLNVEELEAKCIELGGAGFNTNGWIKRGLKPENEWSHFSDDPNAGTYVNQINSQWAKANTFFNAGYSYQLMLLEDLYQTSTLQVQDGANVGITAKQQKAYFGMGVLMTQFIRPLSVWMVQKGAFPTYKFHAYTSDPINTGTPLEQLQEIGKVAAQSALTAGDPDSAAFLDEMVLSLANVNDAIEKPPASVGECAAKRMNLRRSDGRTRPAHTARRTRTEKSSVEQKPKPLYNPQFVSTHRSPK